MWALLLAAAIAAEPLAEVSAGVTMARGLVAPGEPVVLGLYIQNNSGGTVTLDTFTEPRCFLGAYAALTLEPPAKALPAPRCQAIQQEVKSGERISASVDLAKVYELGIDHTIDLTWKLPPGLHITMWESGLVPLRVRKPLRSEKVAKDVDLVLEAGTFTFLGHSHKMTMQGGPPSPLIVSYRWTPRGGEPVEETINLETHDGGDQFVVGPYTFERQDHDYGRSMTLRVFSPASPR